MKAPGPGSSRLWAFAGLCALVLTSAAVAQRSDGSGHVSAALASTAGDEVDADTERPASVFKDIHQHPELGFMETRAAGIAAEELKALGFGVQTGIGSTDAVAVLKNGQGPTVVYRAGMDANAVVETAGLPYASKVRVKREDGSAAPRFLFEWTTSQVDIVTLRYSL